MTTWSDWIDHDFSGFPSHILKEGMVVEIELIKCNGATDCRATFVVGEANVNFSDDNMNEAQNPTQDEGWSEPSPFRCLINSACNLVVGRYRYLKPREQSSTIDKCEEIVV